MKLKFGRLLSGGVIGIFLAVVYWINSIYFGVDIPVSKGIVGSFILVFFCSAVAVYGNIEKLMENFNL